MAAVDAEAIEHALLDALSAGENAEVICCRPWDAFGVKQRA